MVLHGLKSVCLNKSNQFPVENVNDSKERHLDELAWLPACDRWCNPRYPLCCDIMAFMEEEERCSTAWTCHCVAQN